MWSDFWMNWKNNTTKSSKKIVEKKSNEWQTKASPIVMANTSSFQIDNFLEHFKRSASKSKMDSTDWTSNEATSSQGYANAMATTAAATFNHSSPLKTTRTRSSCFDISSISGSSTFGHNKGNFREWGGRTEPSLNTIQSQIEMGPHVGYFYKVYLIGTGWMDAQFDRYIFKIMHWILKWCVWLLIERVSLCKWIRQV